ncbi:hypothetical protein M747DRAFT_101929 [Aspergillus niger ATCC 13496]|uniref:Apple domain-containing protein n=1 Tax=Aspergillus niger ATCC 13496 TaxID=1353008 RepID=A0A370BW53_ASPNG|nr:hypothetical protein M747DRAFT_101929 [Aspergillus niger ATCC 13496]
MTLNDYYLPANNMFSHWAVSALLFAFQATAATATTLNPESSSSSACLRSMQDNTISIFSHAPLTFSFEVPNALACATKCSGVPSCRTWLYSTSGQECQLYREQPFSQADNPLFISGICDESSVPFVEKVAFSSSIIAAPSSLFHQQPTSSAPAKRDGSFHRHHHRHAHGHRL